jgi:hypothetical protein
MGFFMSKIEIPEAKIRQAIWMLKVGKTKKSICEHLGIVYNVKRLDNIIQAFREQQEKEKVLKQKAKEKELTIAEKNMIACSYLEGESQSSLAKKYYISATKIKNILKELNVPIRARAKRGQAETEHIVQELDNKFNKGDRVFYARNNSFAYIEEVYDEDYLEFLHSGMQRWVELVPFTNKSRYSEPKQGIHFEIYYDLANGTSWKLESLKSHIKRVENSIAETGRETYSIYVDGEFSCRKLFVPREELYPVIKR